VSEATAGPGREGRRAGTRGRCYRSRSARPSRVVTDPRSVTVIDLPRSPLHMGTGPHRTASEVARLAFELVERRAWPDLRAVLHPRAVLVSAAGGSVPLGPDALIGALRHATRDAMYQFVTGSPWMDIDEHAAYARGQVRYRTDGGHAMGTRVWLTTARDGLLYRFLDAGSDENARRLYAVEGLDLGL
jgi:hypothetical protein